MKLISKIMFKLFVATNYSLPKSNMNNYCQALYEAICKHCGNTDLLTSKSIKLVCGDKNGLHIVDYANGDVLFQLTLSNDKWLCCPVIISFDKDTEYDLDNHNNFSYSFSFPSPDTIKEKYGDNALNNASVWEYIYDK